MSSGDIKDSLVEQYPATRAADWKRVNKTKIGTFAVRVFTNASAQLDVVTLESASGEVMIVPVPAGSDPISMATTLTQATAQAVGVSVKTQQATTQTNTNTNSSGSKNASSGSASSGSASSGSASSGNTAAPSAPKVKTNAAPNKKALMKKGSKWRVTQDCDIHGWVDNPEYYVVMQKLNASNTSGPARETALKAVGKSMKVLVAKLKAGTVMTVTGKLVADLDNSTWFNGGVKTEGNGHGVPFSFKLGENELLNAKVHNPIFPGHQPYLQPGEAIITGDDVQAVLGYKFIEPFVELEGEAVEQFIYLLRDSATGLFYRMGKHGLKDYAHNPEWDKWLEARDRAFPDGQSSGDAWRKWHEDNKFEGKYGHYFLRPLSNPADYFEWETKPTKAKQYTDMGKLKTSILNFVGYHNGLQESTFSDDAGWMENIRHTDEEDDVGFPFLTTFEAVKMEKFSKREIEVIDLQSWYDRTIRLRALTATYGSAVRALYNKLDKADELATNQYVVLFKSGKKDRWDDRDAEIDPETLKGIEDTIVQIGLKPKTIKRAKAPGSIAFALENLSGAMGLKMGADDVMSVIIDLSTMQELVNE